MSSKVGLVLIVAALAIIVVVAFTVRSSRGQEKTPSAPPQPIVKPPSPAPPNKPTDLVYDVPRENTPPPVSREESTTALRKGIVKTHLRQYRHAVLRNNKDAQVSLLSALKKEKELALQVAQEELAAATEDKVKHSLSDAIRDVEQ